MKRRVFLTVILALVLSLSSVIAVSAAEPSAFPPTPLADQQTLSGSLVGNSAGSFWFATLNYPGAGSQLNITLRVVPADPVTIQGVGFNIYGANGRLVGQASLADVGKLTLNYSSPNAEQLLLQVFNYINGASVDYSITAGGLAQATQVTVQIPENAEPAEATLGLSNAQAAADEDAPLVGSLLGDPAGSFVRFAAFFDTTGQVNVTLNYTPADDIISKGVGLRIYDANGEVAYVGDQTDSNGVLTVSFNAVAGQQYLFVVENYIPSLNLSYTFGINPEPVASTLSVVTH